MNPSKKAAIGGYHLKKMVEAMRIDINSKLDRFTVLLDDYEQNNCLKLNELMEDVNGGQGEHEVYAQVKDFLLVERNFKTFGDFQAWTVRCKQPSVVCDCLFTYAGLNLTFNRIRNLAREMLQDQAPIIEIVGSIKNDLDSSLR